MERTAEQDVSLTFGELLHDCRVAIGLEQSRLGREVYRHGSLICKYEKGVEFPSRSVAIDIINALARHGAPQDIISKLLQEASKFQETPSEKVLDPSLIRLKRQLAGCKTPQDRGFLEGLILSIADVGESFLRARGFNAKRRWEEARKEEDLASQEWEDLTQRVDLVLSENQRDTSYSLGDYIRTVQHGELAELILLQREDSKDQKVQDLQARKAQNHLQLGIAYRRLANWSAADREFCAAEGTLAGNLSKVVECQRKRVCVYLLQGRTEEALKLCEEAKKILPEEDLRGWGKLLQHEAWCLAQKGKWDEAIAKYEKARNLLREVPGVDKDTLELELARADRYLGDLYSMRSEWRADAEKLYRRALDTLKRFREQEIEPKLLLGANLRGLGRILVEKSGNELQGEKDLDDSETLFRSLREPLSECRVYIDKGRLFAKRRLYRRAEGYFLLAIDRLNEMGSLYDLGEGLANLCELYYDEAMENQEEARESRFASVSQVYQRVSGGRIKDLGDLFSIHYSRIQGVMGRVCLHQGKLAQGISLLCDATRTGLLYNKYIFEERFKELIKELGELMRAGQQLEAGMLCEEYEGFWNGNLFFVNSADEPEVRKSLDIIRSKRKEINTIKAAKGRE